MEAKKYIVLLLTSLALSSLFSRDEATLQVIVPVDRSERSTVARPVLSLLWQSLRPIIGAVGDVCLYALFSADEFSRLRP